MPQIKKSPTNRGTEVKVNPAQYVDTTLHAYAEKIAGDYTFILSHAVVKDLQEAENLKLRELRILACLHFFNSPLTPANIAELLYYDPATVTRSAKLLKQAGMITQMENNQDTRSILLTLTDSGYKLAQAYVDRIRTVFADYEEMLTHRLTKEEKLLVLNIFVKISRRSKAIRELCTQKSVQLNFKDFWVLRGAQD